MVHFIRGLPTLRLPWTPLEKLVTPSAISSESNVASTATPSLAILQDMSVTLVLELYLCQYSISSAWKSSRHFLLGLPRSRCQSYMVRKVPVTRLSASIFVDDYFHVDERELKNQQAPKMTSQDFSIRHK